MSLLALQEMMSRQREMCKTSPGGTAEARQGWRRGVGGESLRREAGTGEEHWTGWPSDHTAAVSKSQPSCRVRLPNGRLFVGHKWPSRPPTIFGHGQSTASA